MRKGIDLETMSDEPVEIDFVVEEVRTSGRYRNAKARMRYLPSTEEKLGKRLLSIRE